jgi:hypothetical protein
MKRGIVAAMAFVAAVNAVVLLGVSRNRSGTDSVLEMTERELRLDASSRENSGVSFQIEVNREWDRALEWFDRKKLAEVGFDLSGWKPEENEAVGMKKVLPRRAYVVLELQGDAWKLWDEKMLRDLEKARQKLKDQKEGDKKDSEREVKRLDWRRTHASRLFPVDVGLDPDALRSRYSDRRRYAVTPAVVNLRYERSPDKTDGKVFGSISEILCDRVTVPLHLQGQLAEFAREPEASWSDFYSGEKTVIKAPRYSAVIKYGKRYEPWVESVTRIKPEN